MNQILIHEVKFDGYRSQIVIDDADVRIFTRRGLDWSAKYRDSVDAAKELSVQHAIVDGEIIVTNEAGVSDFAALRKAITRRQHDLYFVAFDLLHLNGHDLRDMPPEDRREILAETIPKAGASNSAKLCMAMRRRSSIWSSRPGWRGWFQSGRTANTEAARRRIG